MLAVPAVPQVAATTFTIGCVGEPSALLIVNDAETALSQLEAFLAFTVYAWPKVNPVMLPLMSTDGPAGENI